MGRCISRQRSAAAVNEHVHVRVHGCLVFFRHSGTRRNDGSSAKSEPNDPNDLNDLNDPNIVSDKPPSLQQRVSLHC